ncbi:MAG: family 10 glycosylhydrolase [Balneolaceae bacterium]
MSYFYSLIRNPISFSAANIFIGVIALVFIVAGCKTQGAIQEDDSQHKTEQETVAQISDEIPETPRDFRAVWVATVANIDWPSEPGLPVEQQKEELRQIMDRTAAMNMNAVIFQVRPATDAMYDSKHEPWSAFLTGKMGEAPTPYYDPLEFAVEEAHKRGLELHAWFNPYRARHPADTNEVAPNHISQEQPDLVHNFGNYQWLDPGLKEVREHSRKVIMDVVKRYDIDGVHLDDYFYPYPSYDAGTEFPDSVSWQLASAEDPDLQRNDWRRSNVDQFIKEVYQDIKNEKPQVQFGISPFGTWRPGHPARTGGFDAYEQLYADARLWLREGWVDYFTPQIYNRIDRVVRPFPVMLQWWVEQNKHDRHMWPGLFTSRSADYANDWPTEEITGQIYIANGQPGVTGSVHFSMRSLLGDWNNLANKITAGPYAMPALVPASPWIETTAPDRPSASMNIYDDKMIIEIESTEDVRWWVLWSKVNDNWEMDIIPGSQHNIIFKGTEASVWPEKVALSGVNEDGDEGSAKVMNQPEENQQNKSNLTKPEMVDRNEWGDAPGGSPANAVRRNLAEGDALEFRDLTIVHNEMISGKDSTLVDSLEVFKNDSLEFGDKKLTTAPDTAKLTLYRYGITDTVKVPEGEAFNWSGYHIGALAVNTNEDVLAGGLAEIEVATVSSLSVTRAGAEETGGASNRFRVPHEITDITLHHSGSAEPLTEEDDLVEKLQNLYEWGVEERNWWDVPYHYLIGLDGTIYEGRDPRYAGETNTRYDTRGHLLITVMGNYDKQEPTDEQVEAITDLMTWSADKYNLSTDNISGHYDLADTGCPGTHLRDILENGKFHEAVEKQLESATSKE